MLILFDYRMDIKFNYMLQGKKMFATKAIVVHRETHICDLKQTILKV